ncbi:MAG: hypothetical protein U0235_09595 [Polyangiaceae bacterium]
MKLSLIAPAAFALLLATSMASAQTPATGTTTPTQTQSTYAESKTSDGSAVVFKDDLATADGLSAAGAVLKVRGGPARFVLIKPRMNFIDALRKSVENL